MLLRNHIASNFIGSEYATKWICEQFRNKGESEDAINNVWDNIKPDNQPIYYITNTIIDKLKLIKLKSYNWSVFNHLDDGKKIFIFKNGDLLWSMLEGGKWFFLYTKCISFTEKRAECLYVPCRVILSDNDTLIEPNNEYYIDFIYRMLCFYFLSDNEEKIVNPGKSYGTKKQSDALSNDSDFPITIVNSNWNVTSIRNEGFNVSGHFRLQPCGLQRAETKMIFIEPFKKFGYVKKSINQNHI